MTGLEIYTDGRGDEHAILEASLPTGDPIDGGWALVDHHNEGDYRMIAWQPVVDEGDPQYGKFFEYFDLGAPDDVSDWANLAAVAKTVGLERDELTEMMNSEDVVRRAWALEAVAAHYGWHELTAGVVEQRNIFEMIALFGEAFDAPELDVEYESLGGETGIRITGADYDGEITIVEWGWIEPHPDYQEEIQRIEYSVEIDSLFVEDSELEAVLLLSDPDEQAQGIETKFREQLSTGVLICAPEDVRMVTEVGDDE